MEGVGSPPEQLSESFLTPLVISMAGVVSASLAIVSLHQFIVRYCLRGLLRSSTNIISGSEPLSNLRFPNGVEEKILISIPILPYSTKDDRQKAFRVDQSECAICLGELEDGEMVRLLPNCRHVFHVECIDNWFLEHTSCPICRSPVVEPISTFDVTLPTAADVRNEEGVQDLTLVHRENSVNTSIFDVSASSSRVEPSGLPIRHSMSSMLPMEGKQQCLATGLKRSISMDQYFVLVNIQSESNKEESSSSRNVLVTSRSYRSRSLSSRSMRSFSELRRSRSTTNGILPY